MNYDWIWKDRFDRFGTSVPLAASENTSEGLAYIPSGPKVTSNWPSSSIHIQSVRITSETKG